MITVNGSFIDRDDIKWKGKWSENKKLIQFLRDDLQLTSVKEGCGEGACGSCMVLIDGKATRACIPKLGKLTGKSILTVEGLPDREKEIYAYSFGAAGAVQCGFCIPGIVISAKSLLDKKPDPSRAEVKEVIKGNLCRCTGYVKIIDAILMSAKYLRSSAYPQEVFTGKLGENLFRLDAREKTLGTGLYTDDLIFEGMVYGRALRTKYPRARILAINSSKAEDHPDCIRVITADHIPGDIKCGHIIKDWDALIAVGDITRYIGDALAIAVAYSQSALDEILSLIEVEYEILTPLTSPAKSLAEDAPKIHKGGNILSRQHIKKGDADKAIAQSKYVVTNHFSLPFTEHAFLEPECAIALPVYENGTDEPEGILLYSGGQGIYDELNEIKGLLGIENVRVRSMLVGGGFGGKEDMSVQHHAALAAWLVKKPVKIKFSRQESITVHPKRHAMEIDLTCACDENGYITAVKGEIVSDTGAYASLGGPVLQRACTHAGGPYNFQNIDIVGTAVYTNNPPAGAYRGFGVPQSAFAMESNLNLLAEKVGISPWEIRYRNAIRPGQVLPNGQKADTSTALAECLLAVRDIYEKAAYAGISSFFKNSGLGVGVPDIGRCILSIERGKIHIRASAACIGQGMATILAQMVCETIPGVKPDMLVVEPPDTARTPNSGTTTASRQTLFTGEATVSAARKLLAVINQVPGIPGINEEYLGNKEMNNALKSLEGQEFYGEYAPITDSMGSDVPYPVSHIAYGYGVQVVEIDKKGKLTKVTAAYDAGRIVNPKGAEGQVEGGILMGLGYALTEDFPLEEGYPKAKMGTLGLFRAPEVPDMEVFFVEGQNQPAAHGAKGVGEIATIPTAPAVQGAYYKLDGIFRTKLPLDGTYYSTHRC